MAPSVLILGGGIGGITPARALRARLPHARVQLVERQATHTFPASLLWDALLRRFIVRHPKPVLAAAFPTASHTKVDRRLLVGAALFGAGWGLSGYCPGPALTSLASGASTALTFVAAMLGGMLLFRLWESPRTSHEAVTSGRGGA